jgi:hypothetical protein
VGRRKAKMVIQPATKISRIRTLFDRYDSGRLMRLVGMDNDKYFFEGGKK